MHIVPDKTDFHIPDALHENARRFRPTIRYLSQTEVHSYGLSIAASVLLSLYPFLVVMFTMVRDVFHIPSAAQALEIALLDSFPGDLGHFIVDNLKYNLSKGGHGKFQAISLILLLFTANGIFEPLEVALNRAWGAKTNRSYIRNQVLSFALILLCGGLVIGSVILTAINQDFVTSQFGVKAPDWLTTVLFKLFALPMTMMALFLTYWLLPNCPVPWRRILPVSVTVGAALELFKNIALLVWPWLDRKLTNEYGVFRHSVEVLLFAMVGSFIVLAGAEWSARSAARESTRSVEPI